MSLLIPLLLAQAAPLSGKALPVPAPEDSARYQQCVDLATSADPHAGELDAIAWQRAGGGVAARQCLGVALANQRQWLRAATEFEGAADDAEVAHDDRAATYWAQAGNAWLLAGDPAKARSDLDAALGAGTLKDLARGEAAFDRARALVAVGNLVQARVDLDVALAFAKADPLVWLASATLARRMHDLPRARADVLEAYRLSPDDPSIDLEIGNIAAAGGDEAGARAAWSDAARIGGDQPAGKSARDALKQFDAAPVGTAAPASVEKPKP